MATTARLNAPPPLLRNANMAQAFSRGGGKQIIIVSQVIFPSKFYLFLQRNLVLRREYNSFVSALLKNGIMNENDYKAVVLRIWNRSSS